MNNLDTSQQIHTKELVQKNRELLNVKSELEEQNQKLKQEVDDITKRFDDQEKQILGLNDKVKDLTNKNTDLEGQVKAQNAEITQLQKDNQKFQKEIQSYQETDQENQALKTELATLRDKLRDLQDYISKKKIDDTKEFIQYLETKTTIEALREHYDCRIGAESFFPLLQGGCWPIEIKNWKEYQINRERPTLKVAVLGYENVGKSWILSKLMQQELPQGKSTKTRGLCLLYPKEYEKIPWIALDTPGSNVSVKVESLKKEQEMEKYLQNQKLSKEELLRMFFGDNILIETLLQEFVVNYSEVLLVIVGKLKRDDQKLISRIRSLPGKRVLIIHNLMEVRNKEDVEKIIEEDILDTFDVQKKEIFIHGNQNLLEHNRTIYVDNEYGKTNHKIEHLIIAHENSTAGDYYNKTTLDYIHGVISTTTLIGKWELITDFQKYLNVCLKKFLCNLPGVTSDETASVVLQENGQGIPASFKLKSAGNYELKLSSANEFGRIETFEKDGLNNVPFTVKIFNIEDQRYLRIEFEIVGDCDKKDLKISYEGTDNEFRVIIKGKSKSNLLRDEEQISPNVIKENTRKFGAFKIETEQIILGSYSIFKGVMPDYDEKSIQGLKILTWELEADESVC